ncbi:hypothetical protein AVEN_247863-1, partial [Araneus ventricosus]
MLEEWQTSWKNSDTGRKIYNTMPSVSLRPTNWIREDVIFFSQHGLFPAYLKSFHLSDSDYCSCGYTMPRSLLYVPEKKNRETETGDDQEPSDTLLPPQDDQERRPSVTDALRIPYRRASERAHRFLKVKARHFTDGQ